MSFASKNAFFEAFPYEFLFAFPLVSVQKCCGEFAESCGELSKLSAIANHYIPATYTASAESWRVVRKIIDKQNLLKIARK